VSVNPAKMSVKPTKPEILSTIDSVETALTSMVHRWQDGIPAEVRDEINTQAREPLLTILIRAGVRPKS